MTLKFEIEFCPTWQYIVTYEKIVCPFEMKHSTAEDGSFLGSSGIAVSVGETSYVKGFQGNKHFMECNLSSKGKE